MNNSQKKPYAGTSLVKYLKTRIRELEPWKTESRVASEAGFVNPKMLAMIKIGTVKLPLDRVSTLAKALGCDPVMLFMLAIEQLSGDIPKLANEQTFVHLVTENEVVWLEEIHCSSNRTNPRLTSKARSAIRGIFGK